MQAIIKQRYGTGGTAGGGDDGGLVRLSVNDAWYADDPFVLAHPDLFSDAPPDVKYTVERRDWDVVVEQATANPGQKRGVKK